MKKLLALILAGLMIFSFASCAKNDAGKNDVENAGSSDKEEAKLEGVEAPVDILEAIWATYDAETEKFFAAGGDMENMVDNAPGAYNLANKEAAVAELVLNDTTIAMVDEAARLVHAMNANNFTAAAYHIAEGSTAKAFLDGMKDAIKNNQWICGFPEKLLVAELSEEYVVVVYGAGDLVETFKTKLTAKYDFAKVTVDSLA